MGRFVEPLPSPPPQLPEAFSKGVAKPRKEKLVKGDAAERIVKYVPVEIVSGYVFVLGLTQAIPTGPARAIATWLCFVVGLASTPVYLFRQQPKPEQQPQVWIATFAFVLWAYLLGGPFALAPLDSYYSAATGSVVVGLYTWLVGLFYIPQGK